MRLGTYMHDRKTGLQKYGLLIPRASIAAAFFITNSPTVAPPFLFPSLLQLAVALINPEGSRAAAAFSARHRTIERSRWERNALKKWEGESGILIQMFSVGGGLN